MKNFGKMIFRLSLCIAMQNITGILAQSSGIPPERSTSAVKSLTMPITFKTFSKRKLRKPKTFGNELAMEIVK